MDHNTIHHPAEQGVENRPVFRKIGFFYMPSSFNGWLLLVAAVAMCIHASLHSGIESPPALLVVAFSLPPFFLYRWIARHCSGVVRQAVNNVTK